MKKKITTQQEHPDNPSYPQINISYGANPAYPPTPEPHNYQQNQGYAPQPDYSEYYPEPEQPQPQYYQPQPVEHYQQPNDNALPTYASYDNYPSEEKKKSSFSLFGFILKLLFFLLILLIIFGLLIEFGVVKGFDDYKPSKLFKKDSFAAQEKLIDGFDNCKKTGGEVREDVLSTCKKDNTMYFKQMTKEELDQKEAEQNKKGVITLSPVDADSFSKFVVGDGYSEFQKGLVAYSSNPHKSWSSFAYMVINNSDLPSTVGEKTTLVEKVKTFVKSGTGYEDQPYILNTFQISKSDFKTSHLFDTINSVEYKNVDGYRAFYAMDGENDLSRLVVRVFAYKGTNVIMLEENLDKDDNKTFADKYYKPCIVSNGQTAAAISCYITGLKSDTTFQGKVSDIGKTLVETFEIAG